MILQILAIVGFLRNIPKDNYRQEILGTKRERCRKPRRSERETWLLLVESRKDKNLTESRGFYD